ncbi:AI-2E family transporter [Rothia amarae]|uniref:AI-2E family transporter n=1 Tax=Rothia amarae TaxID=169480 RepID=A0A7H2BIV7_9MICC|nr:AI-2E family transporter [Rothia amarae]QNV39603.1 AI-2E family transporter [Rothia amarae]
MTHTPQSAESMQDSAVQHKSGWPFGLFFLLGVAALVVSFAGLKTMASVIGPTFLALSLVIAVRPIREWLVKKRVPTFLAAMITLLVLIGLLVALIGSLTYSVFALVEILPQYSQKFQSLYDESLGWITSTFGVSQNQISDQSMSFLEPSKIMNWLTTFLNGLSATGSGFFLLVMVMAFLVVDSAIISGRGAYLRNHRPHLASALADFQHRTNRYWVVNTVFGLIVAVINVVALMILGVPLAIVWGIFSFVTNYIPNIGFVLGMIPPALVALLDGDVTTMIWVIVLFSVINFTMQQIVQPKITGDAVGLNTTVTFLSLIIWSMIIGPLGAILAVPLTLFFKAIVLDSDPRTHWISVFFTTNFAKVNPAEVKTISSKEFERAKKEEKMAEKEQEVETSK